MRCVAQHNLPPTLHTLVLLLAVTMGEKTRKELFFPFQKLPAEILCTLDSLRLRAVNRYHRVQITGFRYNLYRCLRPFELDTIAFLKLLDSTRSFIGCDFANAFLRGNTSHLSRMKIFVPVSRCNRFTAFLRRSNYARSQAMEKDGLLQGK